MNIRLKYNRKTIFTRMCITEAILALLKTTPYEKLRISAVARKAGVARMTFYNYYDSIYAALADYVQIIVAEYVETSGELSETQNRYLSYEHILYSLNFFDQYRDYFITMSQNNLYAVLINAVNEFLTVQLQTSGQLSIYELYAYAGGLLNAFLKWELDGKKDTAEEVAEKIYKFYGFGRIFTALKQAVSEENFHITEN